MSALDALKAARDAGVRLSVDGDALVLDADTEPPAAVLDMLSRHKAGVVSLVLAAKGRWSRSDWLAFFDERAAIAEVDGGLLRATAEARAFSCCVAEWLKQNHTSSPAGRCLACGEREITGDNPLPFGTDQAGHVWLHSRCWHPWRAARHAEAAAALVALGVAHPVRFPNDFGKNGGT